MLNDSVICETEPARSVSNCAALVASAALMPVRVTFVIPVTGNPDAPSATRGTTFALVAEFECCTRTSAPPLNACLPRVQLTVSPYVQRGVEVSDAPWSFHT